MTKTRRAAAAGMLALILCSFIPSSTSPVASARLVPPAVVQVPPAVPEAVAAAEAKGDSTVQLNYLVDTPAAVTDLERAVREAGGQVVDKGQLTLQAILPTAAVAKIGQTARVVAVGADQGIPLEQAHVAAFGDPVTTSEAGDLAKPDMDAIGADQFRSTEGVQGSNVVVAVIDTGVDPDHPALRETPGGAAKIIDWKDFTAEGHVETDQTVSWASSYRAPDGRLYILPPQPGSSRSARFGYWDEFTIPGRIDQDLDRNWSHTDRFGVLLVDAHSPGVYDTVYVDTNNDGDFTDEEPLSLFSQSHAVGHMGRIRVQPASDFRLNFAVAEIDAKGQWVSLGFDGEGHGTQVAGIVGGYVPGGFAGVAPGVQIMALKALNSSGSGPWFTIQKAILYAATHGANIINLSIGELAAAASFDPTAPEWLNQISRTYGSLIVLAAGNTGPGLSSGTTLGDPSEVMAVGAYYSSAMWKRDFGYVVPHESIWSDSGMGPRSDGSYLPNVVAPAGSPTASPLWLNQTGYASILGTSIAAPYTSGAAALLMEAGRKEGLPSDRLSIKRSLELGARRIAGFDVYEQGYGVVNLPAAFTNLQHMDSMPALKARDSRGNGGLLARSYTPGSTSFWVTNLGADITRIGIYSSENWVRPAYTTLTIPPDAPRQLPLQLTPPQEIGVHSAFLQLAHHDNLGPSITIPITYVKPIDLVPDPDKGFSTAESLEVGRYRRYFFNVAPGVSSLDMVARIPLLGQGEIEGTASVHLFRPDGRVVYQSDIGFRGASLTARTTVTDPVQGVWELVVAAEPDTLATPLSVNYTLDVKARPGMLSGVPLQFNAPAGSALLQSLKLTNTGDAFTGHAEAVGVTLLNPSDPWNTGLQWQVIARPDNLIEDFTLKEFTARLRAEVNNLSPVGTSAFLSLYYLDPYEGLKVRGRVPVDSDGHALIELTNLPPGRYQTLLEVDGAVPRDFQYQYRRLVGIEAYMAIMDDPIRQHERGGSWSVDLNLKTPHTPGRYVGQVFVVDTEHHRSLGWFPFELSVGQPTLSVAPMVTELTVGQPGVVVLQLRDGATHQLTNGSITVNGQQFTSLNGLVSVPVTPGDSKVVLNIEANLPAYQFLKTQLTVPVRTAWSLHPLGIDPIEQWAAWRQKVASELSHNP